MGKTKIQFSFEDKDYTREFTADSIKKMERGGFDFAGMDKKLFTLGEDLFYGALIANHPNTPMETAKRIYDDLATESGEDALVTVLGEMIGEAIESIQNKKGNVQWKVVR